MRHALLVLPAVLSVLSLVSGCGEDGNGPAPIELPVVTACGDLPAGPFVVTVRVNADSEVFVPEHDGPISLLTLKRHLIERRNVFGAAARYVNDAPGWANSKMDIIIEADAAASWAATGWVMSIASAPWLLAHRFHFRVRLADTGDEGAFSYIAPVAGPMSARMPFPDFEDESTIRLCDGGEGTHLTQFHAALTRQSPAVLADTLFHVDLYDKSTTITVQDMLSVLDLMRRAGARQMTWLTIIPLPYRCHREPAPSPPSSREADLLATQRVWIADHALPHRPLSVDFARRRLSARPNALPLPTPRRHAGPYGWTAGTVFAWEPVITDEDDLPFEETFSGDDR